MPFSGLTGRRDAAGAGCLAGSGPVDSSRVPLPGNAFTLVVTPLSIFTSFYRHRPLVWAMTRRDVAARYRGSAMGILWSLVTPIFLLAVYTLVFRGILTGRWGVGLENETGSEFAVLVFSGMVVHLFFAEAVNRAPFLVLGNANYVKRVVFPLEILPWMAVLSALFHTLLSVGALLVASAIVFGKVHWTVVFLPLPLLCLATLMMGIMWFLASLGVYLRDVGQTVTLLTSVLLFLSPVFYPAEMLKGREPYYTLLHLNPLTFIIEQVRELVVWGRLPNFGGLAIYFVCSVAIAWLGLAWFQKTRRGFADVI